ncbi:uncharacterized protein LOC143029472 [Oratosquilla oratoria]|uniref:uncharacterized protein LOC143029472 n=1 Tax=Oratosquilla oratoria TaxID=337810 RepID=UPI003F75985C
MALPNSEKVGDIIRMLRSTEVKAAVTSGTKIGDMIKSGTKMRGREDSVVYKIPCTSCNKAYYGETKRGLNTRIRERKADLRHHRLTNAMVVHVDDSGHLPQWNRAEILHEGMDKKIRKSIEAAYITTCPNINNKAGSFTWAKSSANIALRDWLSQQANQDAALYARTPP